jgi:hypothetical protein
LQEDVAETGSNSSQDDAAVAAAAYAGSSASSGPVNPLSDLYAVLEGSALIPFLESKLQANSFLEIGRHTAVYKMVIGIIRELAFQVRILNGRRAATRPSTRWSSASSGSWPFRYAY